MKANRALATMALIAGALSAWISASAQTNALGPRAIPNRYLLIVETSRAMHHRSEGMIATVRELLDSGLEGQLRPGDTIGLWTFNSTLAAGQFPLQDWSPTQAKAITSRVTGFLKEQKYSGSPRFEQLLPALHQVVAHSEFITIVLVTSGAEPITGTPFDTNLNKYFSDWRNQQEKARMPFLAALRAEKGKLADFAVNVAPWKLELPALPPQLLVAYAVHKAAPAPKATAPVMLPPLIISGRKPAPPASPSPAAPVVAEQGANPGATVPASANPVRSEPVSIAANSANSGAVSASPQSQSPVGSTLVPSAAAALTPSAAPSLKTSAPLPDNPQAVEVAQSATSPNGASERSSFASGAEVSNRGEKASVVAESAPRSNGGAPASTTVATSPFLLLFLRVGLALVVLVLLAWVGRVWLTRSRGRAHTSLITRSFQRK